MTDVNVNDNLRQRNLSVTTNVERVGHVDEKAANPVVTPSAGTHGLRDPFVMRRQDGTFAVLATDLNGKDFTQQNQYIHLWDSADLRSFTGYRRVRMPSMTTHIWHPRGSGMPAATSTASSTRPAAATSAATAGRR
ncbi:hypothetical protein [Micromonospora sp. LOL_021]|uniref:hypothetical protein n=1 Tax=Micromonospora sp. LOL_021 TaxID=3345417 RepID=UPI003A847685